MAKRKVTQIPATINKFTAKPVDSKKKRKVAGYARVSTDHEDQTTSYAAQVDYYTNYIKSRDDWEFAGLYSDEGISATNTKKRDGFNKMIVDALAGKIDLIITKSVSRFARNTVDFLTKKVKTNEGEVPQYYVENNHPAIIEPELFDLVQSEIQRRGKGSSRYSGVTIFSSKVQCAECGGWYGSKVWHSNDKYRRVIYQCNNKFRHKTGCNTPHLTEFEIKDYFVKAVNQLIMEKADLIKQKESLEEEINVTVEMTQNIVAENARVAQNQDEYNKRYNSLVERYHKLKEEYDEVCTTISDKDAKYEQMGRFIKVLKGQQELITEFDESLWSSLTEKIVVKSKEEVTVVFKDGTEITVE